MQCRDEALGCLFAEIAARLMVILSGATPRRRPDRRTSPSSDKNVCSLMPCLPHSSAVERPDEGEGCSSIVKRERMTPKNRSRDPQRPAEREVWVLTKIRGLRDAESGLPRIPPN